MKKFEDTQGRPESKKRGMEVRGSAKKNNVIGTRYPTVSNFLDIFAFYIPYVFSNLKDCISVMPLVFLHLINPGKKLLGVWEVFHISENNKT